MSRVTLELHDGRQDNNSWNRRFTMKALRTAGVVTLVLLAILALAGGPAAAQQKPNIVVIMER
jgi:hypothetical protein